MSVSTKKNLQIFSLRLSTSLSVKAWSMTIPVTNIFCFPPPKRNRFTTNDFAIFKKTFSVRIYFWLIETSA